MRSATNESGATDVKFINGSALNASTANRDKCDNITGNQPYTHIWCVYHYRIPLDGIPLYHDFIRLVFAASLPSADNTFFYFSIKALYCCDKVRLRIHLLFKNSKTLKFLHYANLLILESSDQKI